MHASQEITPFSVLLFLGTDATHAEHIETIKTRMYIGVNNDGRFVPGQLGMGLVEGRCLKNVLGYLIGIRLSLMSIYFESFYRCKRIVQS